MFTVMKCLQSGTVSSLFLLLAFGICLMGWSWHAWSGVCVGGSAPRTTPVSETVGRAAHPT